MNDNTSPPRAPKHPHEHGDHKHTRMDDYHWLRERENPEVIAYLKAENEYAEKSMKGVKNLREELFEEIVGRIPQKDISAPYLMRGYAYYRRYEEGKEYAIHCRRRIEGQPEEVMIDGNERARNHPFYQIGGLEVSDDNRLIAFGEDVVSRRIYTIRFKDLEQGKMLKDELTGTAGSVVWAQDNQTVFYSRKDPETLRSYQIYRHRFGTVQSQDVLVYEEKDETFYTYVRRSNSGKYIFICSKSTMTSEYRYVDAASPESDPRIFQERKRGLEYDVEHGEEVFYVLHNGGAKNFMLSTAPIDATSQSEWKTMIDHRADTLVEDMAVFRDFIVLEERKKGLVRLRIIPLNREGKDWYVEFADPTYMAYLSVNKEYETDILNYGYTSLTTPMTIYDVNMRDGATTLVKRDEIVGGFNPEEYESEYVFVKARDGVKVPVSIVYRKGFEKSGKSPLLLYGYGSYGLSLDAYFSSPRISLLDRGFAFAIAHIRGGQEMGREWYEQGRLAHKTNTFYDFIDCAKFLIENRYTSADHLYAMGGSAGGLLMGVVVNMEPSLWNGVVAQVPFVDVLTTMLDASIPLTTGEYDEWGNPENEEDYVRIRSYSPYDNLRRGPYPAMLVTTGIHDSQVQYWEPAKWVAKIRDMKTNDTPLFLVTNLETGHGGASGRFEKYREVALDYAFLLSREGITK